MRAENSNCERAEFAARIARDYPCIAFYYGAQDPKPLLGDFQIAVVEAGHGHPLPDSPGAAAPQWLAYVSLGEVLSCAPYFAAMPAAWRIGRNDAWDAWIIDQTPAAWPAFLVGQIAEPIWQRGYQGFFLDTVDSYALLNPDQHPVAAQRAGLKTAIQALRDAFPQAAIVLNRGFELLPTIHGAVDAVTFESLYDRWNQAARRYEAVSKDDRAWLLAQVESAKSHGLPVIALDYCAPEATHGLQDRLERISRHGIVPYIADGPLQRVYWDGGRGAERPEPPPPLPG